MSVTSWWWEQLHVASGFALFRLSFKFLVAAYLSTGQQLGVLSKSELLFSRTLPKISVADWIFLLRIECPYTLYSLAKFQRGDRKIFSRPTDKFRSTENLESRPWQLQRKLYSDQVLSRLYYDQTRQWPHSAHMRIIYAVLTLGKNEEFRIICCVRRWASITYYSWGIA